MQRFFSYFLLIAFLFVLTTCTKDYIDSQADEDRTEYVVTYTDKTIVIDSSLLGSLVRVDTAAHIYYFKSSEAAIANLKKDDILLIHGLALRKVATIKVNGDETRVTTSYANLNEAIKDGSISWSKAVKFNEAIVPSVSLGGQEYGFKSGNADGFEFEFEYGGLSYAITFAYSDTKADVKFQITKELASAIKAKFTATGSIENFTSSAELEYENSELKKFGQKNSNLKGDLTLNLTVAGSGRDDITLDFPVVLMKYPIMVGPIPVIINVKVLFVINCVVPIDGSSQVEVKFGYNSTTGIQYNGLDVSADASMGNQSMDKKKAETGASSAIGVNFGLAFPRLEVGIFDEVIVPWIQTAFLIGGDYTFTPACQQARSQFIGACGLDLSFLGFSYSASKTLWQEEKILLKAGDCD